MGDSLRHLRVLALDAQASGATPAYGDLIELGWGVCSAEGPAGAPQTRWVIPRTRRPIGRAVRELTGWSEAVLKEAVEEADAWTLLRREITRSFGEDPSAPVPTVIHFARFEQPFLRDLHERLDSAAPYPFDTVCLHAVAARFLPDLPRRNIRALAGYFGHSPELLRRSSGHVEATAFIWRGLVPLLEAAGVRTWSELKQWLCDAAPARRSARRSFPLAAETRRSLPDAAGVYRFLRPNGQIVYVGKAVSLKKRVASHFKSRGPATERSLELLSQVHAIDHTETASLLEAALLETDEIKRLDPPYNVQLRSGERSAWFASRDLRDTRPAPDDAHPLGPLPSERALSGLPALAALADGAEPSRALLAAALAVPAEFLPDRTLFDEGFEIFSAEHLARHEPDTLRRITGASLALWLARGRVELESPLETAPGEWDLARVRRRLERALVQGGLLLRRARLLALLADADVAFREAPHPQTRALAVAGTKISSRHDLENVAALASLPRRRAPALRTRQAAFDAAAYDRMRVLLTELRRIFDESGEIAVRTGGHLLEGERLARVLRAV
ncbi:MAG TPA: GIY-YIG nuclease family protein [Polyangiaceae bacterium]